MERIKAALDKLNVKYNIDPDTAYIEFWTDTANHDVFDAIEYNGTPEDFVNKFEEIAEGYDIDDEVEIYIPMRGTHGVPSSVRTILEDIEEAKKTWMDIATTLRAAIQ